MESNRPFVYILLGGKVPGKLGQSKLVRFRLGLRRVRGIPIGLDEAIRNTGVMC